MADVTQLFNCLNKVQTWQNPSGRYIRVKIECAGASGGNATGYGYTPGKGAKISGEFLIPPYKILTIMVGGQGGNGYYAGGGGGATWVYSDFIKPLIVAGAGGGAGASGGPGADASVTTSSVAKYSHAANFNGIGYGGGGSGSGWGGPGAGWYSDGDSALPYSYPGRCPKNGGYGGARNPVQDASYTGLGGYGGGGGGGQWGGGGGGGYTGAPDGNGGGGSYNDGTNPYTEVSNVGNGYCKITILDSIYYFNSNFDYEIDVINNDNFLSDFYSAQCKNLNNSDYIYNLNITNTTNNKILFNGDITTDSEINMNILSNADVLIGVNIINVTLKSIPKDISNTTAIYTTSYIIFKSVDKYVICSKIVSIKPIQFQQKILKIMLSANYIGYNIMVGFSYDGGNTWTVCDLNEFTKVDSNTNVKVKLFCTNDVELKSYSLYMDV